MRLRRFPISLLFDLSTRKELPILGMLSPDIIRRGAEAVAKEIKLMKVAEN